jgi:predicted AlkP superfamily phosphohydrolase/phosphomutase
MDSGDPVLLEQWMDSGELPHLAKLREKGVSTIVESPMDLGNGTMWQTMATGCNMGRHGLNYFKQIKLGTYQIFETNEDVDCQVPTVWKRLSDAGRQCLILDIFRTPSANQLNGIQISDWQASFRTLKPRSTPPDAISDIMRRFGPDPFDGNADDWYLKHRDPKKLLELMRSRMKSKTKAIVTLMNEQSFDLFMGAYADSHDIAHLCWNLHDPAAPRFDAELAAELGDPVLAIYREFDDSVGEILNQLTNDDVVVFFAGLGFQNLYSVGNAFEEILARLDPGEKNAPVPSIRGKRLSALRNSFLRKLLPNSVRRLAGKGLLRMTERAAGDARHGMHFFTLPCEGHAGAVRFNLIGREPSGKIAPAELDAVFQQLREDLLAIKNVETGRPMVIDVVRTAESYHGPCLDDLPDAFVVWDRKDPIRHIRSPQFGDIKIDYDVHRTGDHTPYSYFMVSQAGATRQRLERHLKPEDVGATLMALCGGDYSDLDGEPAFEMTGDQLTSIPELYRRSHQS